MRVALAFVIGLATGLVVLAPAAMRVEGSLWQPRLAGATLGQLQLGDVTLRLQPAGLVQGRLQWQATGAVSGLVWRGLATGGASAIGGRMDGSPLPGLPLTGVALADVSAALDGAGRCLSAGGQVVADLALPLAGQRQLAGAPRCDGAALLLPLASSDGRVRLDLASSDGRWTARLVVAGAGAGETSALLAAGFRSEAGALVKAENGTW